MTFFKQNTMKNKNITFLLSLIILLLSITSCNKSDSINEAHLTYKLISDKTWYLEYAQTTNASGTSIKSYVGQSTYFINYLKNYTTKDSDGIVGNYALQNVDNKLLIKVDAKTQNGNVSSYQYELLSIGAKNMILSNSIGTTKTIYYFNTHR